MAQNTTLASLITVAITLACHCAQAATRTVATPRVLVGAAAFLVSSPADFVAALANPSISVALLQADIALSDEDFADSPPILLERNFTVLGAPPADAPDAWPVLSFGYTKNKVHLAPHVVFNISRVVAKQLCALPQWQAPGLDMLNPRNSTGSLPAGNITSALVIEDAVIIFRACLPSDDASFYTATLARPPQFPGRQASHRAPPEEQRGCTNSTSAHVLQRCWPALGAYDDLAMFGSSLDGYGKPLPTGYTVYLHRAAYRCEAVLDDECIQLYGSTGCFNRLFPAGSATPYDSPPPPAPSPVPTAAAVASGGGGSGNARVGTLLGAVLGGLVLLATTSILAVLYARQRRRHSSGCYHSSTAGVDEGSKAAPPLEPPSAHVMLMGKDVHSARCGEPSPNSSSADAGRATEGILSEAAGGGPYAAAATHRPTSLDFALVTVTPLTPVQPGIPFSLHPDSGELILTRVVLGKGASARVVEGVYLGARVAVKLLDLGLHAAAEGVVVANTPAAESSAAAGGGGAGSAAAAAGGADAHHGVQNCCVPQRHALQREVEILARCQHPNIIRLLAANLSPQRICLVMELMDTSLDKLLHGRAGTLLPLPMVVHVMTHVALALSYLHPTVLHRDVKPANVLISRPDGPCPIVKLADFGLSRLLSTVLVTKNPETGTAPYMAPELFDCENTTVSDRADVYAWGVVLWECLSGQRPWAEHSSVVQVAFAVTVLHRRPPLGYIPRERRSRRLCGLMSACWRRDPARRPAAAEVVKLLTLAAEDLATP